MKRVALAAAAAGLFLATSATAEVELRYATAAPEPTPWGKFLLDSKVDIEKAAPDLKMNIFFSSQLGDEQTVLRQVVRGRIDVSGQSNTATSLVVPEFALLAAPYLFDSVKQADCVFDKHVRPIFEDAMIDSGLVPLSWVEVGQNILFTKTPVKTVADIKNYKLRVPPTRPAALYYEQLGAAGVPMGVVDMVPALKTGQIDGIATVTVYGIAIGLPKLAPNVTVINAAHDIGTVTVSKKTWDKLTPAHQDALRLIDAKVNELRTAIRGAEGGLLKKTEAAGVPVYYPSEDDMTHWRAAAQPAHDKLIEELGGDAPDIWMKIQAAKKACSGNT
ncbi:MAG: TRAP transporter substrate-binding protein DctP [Roseitalea porphyridii]